MEDSIADVESQVKEERQRTIAAFVLSFCEFGKNLKIDLVTYYYTSGFRQPIPGKTKILAVNLACYLKSAYIAATKTFYNSVMHDIELHGMGSSTDRQVSRYCVIRI